MRPQPAGVKPFQLRLAPDIRARLQADADRNRRSLNAHIEHVLDEHLPALEDMPASVAS